MIGKKMNWVARMVTSRERQALSYAVRYHTFLAQVNSRYYSQKKNRQLGRFSGWSIQLWELGRSPGWSTQLLKFINPGCPPVNTG